MKKKLALFSLILAIMALPVAACAQGAAPAPAAAPAAAPVTVTAAAPSAATVTAAAPARKTVVAPAAATIELRAVQSKQIGDAQFRTFEEYVRRVNTKARGELTINILGGPEIIGIADQVDGVRNRVVELGAMFGNRTAKYGTPLEMYYLRRISQEEMASRGVFDIFDGALKVNGLMYLGDIGATLNGGSNFFTNIPVTTPQELAGQRFATYGGMRPWVEAVGATASIMPPGERYTAMERGVTDGAVVSFEASCSQSQYEVVSHAIDHGFGNSHPSMIINRSVFDGLPAHLQKILTDTVVEMRPLGSEIQNAAHTEAKQCVLDNGMEFITFSKADEKYFLDLAYDNAWSTLHEKFPVWAAKMKPLLE